MFITFVLGYTINGRDNKHNWNGKGRNIDYDRIPEKVFFFFHLIKYNAYAFEIIADPFI